MNSMLLKESRVGDLFIRRMPGFYASIMQQFCQVRTSSLEEREDYAKRKCRKILKAASSTKYYGRDILQKPWNEIPLVERSCLREHLDAFVNPSLFSAMTATATTSGSTGVPLTLKRSGVAIISEQVAMDNFVSKAGIDLKKARVAILRGDNLDKDLDDFKPPFWRYKVGKRHLTFSSNHLCAQTMESYIHRLEVFDPEVLWVYPTVLEVLTGLSADLDIRLPSLKLILSSSEILRCDLRESASQKFNVPVYDIYGQAERVARAISTKSEEYYFDPAYGRTELLYASTDGGYDYYDVIGTNFWNITNPVLRYRTGDLAKLPRGLSEQKIKEVEYGLRPFLGISGCLSDYLISPEGVHLIGLNHMSCGIDEILQMQVVQTKLDKINIFVVPIAAYNDNVKKKLIKQVRKKIPSSMKIDVHLVEKIERTKSG